MHEIEPKKGLEDNRPDFDRLTERLDTLTESVAYMTSALNAQLVVMMRSYDALIAILESQDSSLADTVFDLHAANQTRNPDIEIPQ